jgi:hypothetical protein
MTVRFQDQQQQQQQQQHRLAAASLGVQPGAVQSTHAPPAASSTSLTLLRDPFDSSRGPAATGRVPALPSARRPATTSLTTLRSLQSPTKPLVLPPLGAQRSPPAYVNQQLAFSEEGLDEVPQPRRRSSSPSAPRPPGNPATP